MIVDSQGMRAVEAASGIPEDKLMAAAGKACAKELSSFPKETSILILAGKGNNGGDGFVIANTLRKKYPVKICLVQGEPTAASAKNAFAKVSPDLLIPLDQLDEAIAASDVIVDAIFGFSYHGELRDDLRVICRKVNAAHKTVWSIDINSGAEAGGGFADKDAIRSDVTLALDCYKPVHMLRKNNQLTKEVRLLDLKLPHTSETPYTEMNEDLFFAALPSRDETSYKGTFGKVTLIGGSYGMVGALSLNVIGARTTGASYIQAVLPEEVYHIAAMHSITTVFHPFVDCNYYEVASPIIRGSSAVGFGSGCVNMPHKTDMLHTILQEAHCPIVFDAEAIRLLHQNTFILRYAKAPVILTPHIGEFASLLNKSTAETSADYYNLAIAFAKEQNVILVLKQPNTIVVSPDGRIYINQSGNEALGQAGSGDVLTGIITGLASMVKDPFTAACMGVWLHGYLAELGTKDHAKALFRLESFPEIMDKLMLKHAR